jgi:predicted aspartyl protease
VQSAKAVTTEAILTTSQGQRALTAVLDTGAEITLVSQRLAVEQGLLPAQAERPRIEWLESQKTHCYGAYSLTVSLTDSENHEQKHVILAYAVDQGETELILGRYSLKNLGIDIQNGPGTWRWGLVATKFRMVNAAEVEEAIKAEDSAVVLAAWITWDACGGQAVTVKSVSATDVVIPPALQSHTDVFNNDSAAMLPTHKTTDHAINLIDGKEPPYGPLYNLSARELEVLREYLDKELKLGRIRYSTSPAGAPLLFVPKKDGTLRLCVDYRALNSVSIKDRCPLPLIDETLSRLTGAWYFASLDLKDAYYRIRIREGDEWKTAFRTRYGHFEYLVMPFGLTNAPATFQAYVNRTLAGLLDDLCVVYLDDILIYTHSRNIEDHWVAVRKVLDRLRSADLFVNLKKCVFASDRTKFLGFVVTRDGVEPDAEKVATIQEWKAPTSLKELQSFLGFANFYRRFVERYSVITAPMTALLKGTQEFTWTSEADGAFRKLKDIFSSAAVMRHYDPERKTKLETDASMYGICGILSQLHEQGRWHPVAFNSRKLTDAERNWEVYDQELLAIVHSFKV